MKCALEGEEILHRHGGGPGGVQQIVEFDMREAASGFACGMLGWIAMWRNVTDEVAPVAALNNVVLPLWNTAGRSGHS